MNNSNLLISQKRYDELYHHGILGMKWGIRRFQNPDGTLTEEGKKRYNPDGSLTEYGRRKRDMKRAAISEAIWSAAGIVLSTVFLGSTLSSIANSYPNAGTTRIISGIGNRVVQMFPKGSVDINGIRINGIRP